MTEEEYEIMDIFGEGKYKIKMIGNKIVSWERIEDEGHEERVEST